jgi:hypothetical protein
VGMSKLRHGGPSNIHKLDQNINPQVIKKCMIVSLNKIVHLMLVVVKRLIQ